MQRSLIAHLRSLKGLAFGVAADRTASRRGLDEGNLALKPNDREW
jgi:hypothetical protein